MPTEKARAAPRGVDAHCHLDDPVFDHDRAEVVAAARAAGIGQILVASADPRRWEAVRRVARQHGLWHAVGIHPWWPRPDALQHLPEALEGAVAVGETGLDYRRASTSAERRTQRALLDAQLEVAAARDLPVVLHAVDALPDVLAALRGSGLRAQLHGAARGDLARAARDGLYLSFGPALHRSAAARRWVAEVPRQQVLLETDAPFGSPCRGTPADVAGLAKVVGEAWGCSAADALATTGDNARTLFSPEAP